MKIEVLTLDKSASNFEKSVKKMVRRLARLLLRKGAIEVYLINSRRMKMLNKKFRGKDKATNVLSFTAPKNFPGEKPGEVYLDPIYIKNHREDLALMLVHGVLHILGYDHEKKNDRIKMEKKEELLLSKLKA